MNLDTLLNPARVDADLRTASKKSLLQCLSSRLASEIAQRGLSQNEASSVSEADIFHALCEREKLGSTGVGRGVAIPHARIEGLTGIIGYFARLHTPIDFGSVDDFRVDLVFMMLAPVNAGADHLKALAKVSRLLRSEKNCEKLRATSDNNALYALIAGPESIAA